MVRSFSLSRLSSFSRGVPTNRFVHSTARHPRLATFKIPFEQARAAGVCFPRAFSVFYMSKRALNRRTFIKGAALAGAGFWLGVERGFAAGRSASDKLNIGIIGVANRAE